MLSADPNDQWNHDLEFFPPSQLLHFFLTIFCGGDSCCCDLARLKNRNKTMEQTQLLLVTICCGVLLVLLSGTSSSPVVLVRSVRPYLKVLTVIGWIVYCICGKTQSLWENLVVNEATVYLSKLDSVLIVLLRCWTLVQDVQCLLFFCWC
jgi:hypothetical protein